MEKLSFRAGEVEGPLDLILTLIARHKLNIYDIEISTLVEQYTAAVREMEEADLEVGSEFIEMAARLVYIKTVELLPKHEKDEDPRRELTGQLLEYQACRQAAALLGAQSRMGSVFTRQPMPALLLAAYRSALGKGERLKPPPAEVFRPLVAARFVSVGSRIVSILRRLYHSSRVSFAGLFSHSRERSEMVATFLALLELMKSGRVRLNDDGDVEVTDYRSLTDEELAEADRQFAAPRTEQEDEDERETNTALREAGLPFELLELEENVQLATAEEYGDLIRSVLSQKRSTPLSQSAMEVLAIIAYNQPVTRAFVEQIRGVDSSSAVNSLVVRDLVEEAGRLELPGRPIAYRTTANFLRCFGLQSLDELPDITTAAQAQEQLEQLSLTPADGQGEEP